MQHRADWTKIRALPGGYKRHESGAVLVRSGDRGAFGAREAPVVKTEDGECPPIERVTVYCASSRSCDPVYFDAARRLGTTLAAAGLEMVYGGGRKGSMGAAADGALDAGGQVVGVLPKFMLELEWGHERLTRLELVDDMRIRKERMLQLADAVVVLPGGSGTFEELFEALSMKRLGFFLGPIVLVDTSGYFAPCVELLERTISERFMGEHHAAMWQVVSEPEEVVIAFAEATPWSPEAQRHAGV